MSYRRRLAYSYPPTVPLLDFGDPVNKSLLGLWRFDNNDVNLAQATAKDWSGNNLTGTLVASPTKVAGRVGGALTFNGTSQYVDCGTSAKLAPAAISVTAWVRATSFANAYNTVVYRNDGAGGAYALYVKSNGKLAVYVNPFVTHTSFYDGSGAFTLSAGIWYNIGFTYSAVAGLVGYVNGLVDATAAADGVMAAGSGSMQIGNDALIGSRLWPGALDEIRVSGVALQQSIISRVFSDASGGLGVVKPRRRLSSPASASVTYRSRSFIIAA